MGRFSRHDAEEKGWVFVAERGERTVIESEVQGRTQTLSGYCRAEKYVDQPSGHQTLINETAETMGKLLEQIAAYEANQERIATDTVEAPIDHTFAPLDTTGLPQRSVAVRVGEEIHYFTEAEWASRDRADAVYGEEGMEFRGGHADSREAAAARLGSEQEVEARRAELAEEAPEAKQVFQDLSQQVVDLPGGATGNVLLVHKDDDSLGDVSRRREAASIEEENARVARVAGPEPGIQQSESVVVEGRNVADVKFSESLEEQAIEAGAQADKGDKTAEIRDAAGAAEQEAHDDLVEEIEEEADDDDDEPAQGAEDASPEAVEATESDEVQEDAPLKPADAPNTSGAIQVESRTTVPVAEGRNAPPIEEPEPTGQGPNGSPEEPAAQDE